MRRTVSRSSNGSMPLRSMRPANGTRLRRRPRCGTAPICAGSSGRSARNSEHRGHRRPDNNPLLFAGALLLTDVAELASERRRVPVAGDRLVFLSRDGRDYGSQALDPCWTFARQLLDAIAPDPSTDETVRLWYRATTAMMARYGVLADAQPHLEHAP